MDKEESINFSRFDDLWHVKRNLLFELVETNFEKHDNTNFETTLTYKKLADRKTPKQKFKIDFYLFVPRSVLPMDYNSQAFLGNLTNHLRLRSVDIPPSNFLDTSNPKSPLHKLVQYKSEMLKNPQSNLSELVVDQTRAAASYILHELKTLELHDLLAPDYNWIAHYNTELDYSRAMLESFRGILYIYNQIFPKRMGPVLDNLNLIDEYISFHLEKRWIRVLSYPQVRDDETLVHSIKKLLMDEFKYRERFRFVVKKSPHELMDEKSGEMFIYYLGLVKKFVQDQLYLNVHYEKTNSHLANSIAMFAAAVAAFFAYSVELISRGVYGWSWDYHALAILGVSTLAYVMKDRMKEIIRSLFQKKLKSYDMRRSIFHPGKKEKPFASTIENVRLLSPERIDDAIKSIRNRTRLAHIQNYRHESTIHYSKVIEIDWERLNLQDEVPHNEIREIYRFNFSDFCRQMDNAYKEINFFDPHSQEVVTTQLPKVYHLNLIFSLCPFSNDKTLDESKMTIIRTRLVMDKNGIKRVESVPTK